MNAKTKTELNRPGVVQKQNIVNGAMISTDVGVCTKNDTLLNMRLANKEPLFQM